MSDASLGPAVGPGRRLAEAMGRILGRPSAPEKVSLLEVVRDATEPRPRFFPDLHFSMGSEGGVGFVTMSAPAAFRFLDRALGGPPGRPQPVRALTEVENRVWRAGVAPILQALQDLGNGAIPVGDASSEPLGMSPESITWLFAWPCESSHYDSSCPETSSWASSPEEPAICVGMDENSAWRWVEAVCPPPPDRSDELLERVCRMAATLPLTVGHVEATVASVASWRVGSVVLLDTPGDAPWHAGLGDVSFGAAPVSMDGVPRLLVTERRSGEADAVTTKGLRPGTGGRHDGRP